MPNSRKCAYPKCGIFFTPKRKNQKYHTKDCRKAHYDEIYFGYLLLRKICPNCGTNFPTRQPLKQAYCGPECRVEAKEKRLKGIALPYAGRAQQRMTEILEEHPDIHVRFASTDGVVCDESDQLELNSSLQPTNQEKPYPASGACELCNTIPPFGKKVLSQYPCDESKPSAVLYLCSDCLAFAKRYDSGLLGKYLALVAQEIKRAQEATEQDKALTKVV